MAQKRPDGTMDSPDSGPGDAHLRWEFFCCDKLDTTICTFSQLLENDHLIKFEVFVNRAFKYLIDNT